MASRSIGLVGNLRTPTPVVVVTIVVLLVMYLVSGVATNFVPGGRTVQDLLYLDSSRVLDGEAWRLLTYGLLHSLMSPFHLLFNALLLWFFARDLEMRFGSLRFLGFLVAGVVVGGLFVVGSALIGIGAGAAIGISAGVEASIVAWALFNRNLPVRLFFMVPIRGIHMLFFAILMWLLEAVSVSDVSASAHAGGIVTGLVTWFLVARRNRLRLFWDELLVKVRLRKGPRLTVVPKKDPWVH
jgi:membrane associated rhomboid family serine protease